MKKAKIPAIHVPVQKSDGSMEWVWYMFFQWLATIAEKTDLSDYFTKEEVNALLDEKVTVTDGANKIYGTDDDGEQYFYDLSYFAADDNVVHKTGDENVDGRKTFLKDTTFNAGVFFKNGIRALFEDTASSKYVNFSDKNDKTPAWIENRINDGGVPGASRLNLWARTYTDNTYTTTVDAAIGILAKPDGTAVASAPNTPNDITTNNVYIVTTKWANNSASGVNNLLHKTGNETSTGIKTFENVNTGYLTVRGSTSSTSKEGGEILLGSAPAEPNAGKNIFIDRYNGSVRIFGANSSGNTKVMLQADIENQIIYAVTPTTDTTSSTEIDTVGARNTAFFNKMTNCITGIPQDINLTLSSGTLTLKAGSKIYLANGTLGNTVIIDNDISVTQTNNGTFMVICTSSSSLYLANLNGCLSGAIASRPSSIPAASGLYFATDENKIYLTGNGGTNWYQGAGYSLPIAVITVSNGAIASINQVFNGFGYIGLTFFVLPGVKGLAPRGRNTNGTLNNLSFTTSSVLTKTLGANSDNLVITLSGSTLNAFSFKYGKPASGYITYQEDENYVYVSLSKIVECLPGFVTSKNGVITSFSTKEAFCAADYNDVYTRDYLDAQLNNKANTSLSNLTSVGANIGNWSSNVTNCITEVPQDINITLSNGTLTLKAGSKVYVPDGSVYSQRKITSNQTYTQSTSGQYLLFTGQNTSIWGCAVQNCTSGTTAPATGNITFYNTSSNTIDWYSGGTFNSRKYSFPFALVTVSNGAISNIDQVFNGFGYIGSSVFVLPGVKALAPNGRNSDGTLKNEVCITTAVKRIASLPDSKGYTIALKSNGELTNFFSREVSQETRPDGTYKFWYVPSENKVYNSGTSMSNVSQNIAASLFYFNATTYEFIPKFSFHAVDYNDADFIIKEQLPSASNNYTYFYQYKSGRVVQGGYRSGVGSVTLPVVMADGYYSIMLCAQSTSTITGHSYDLSASAKTTTGFTIVSPSTPSASVFWTVDGKAA